MVPLDQASHTVLQPLPSDLIERLFGRLWLNVLFPFFHPVLTTPLSNSVSSVTLHTGKLQLRDHSWEEARLVSELFLTPKLLFLIRTLHCLPAQDS